MDEALDIAPSRTQPSLLVEVGENPTGTRDGVDIRVVADYNNNTSPPRIRPPAANSDMFGADYYEDFRGRTTALLIEVEMRFGQISAPHWPS